MEVVAARWLLAVALALTVAEPRAAAMPIRGIKIERAQAKVTLRVPAVKRRAATENVLVFHLGGGLHSHVRMDGGRPHELPAGCEIKLPVAINREVVLTGGDPWRGRVDLAIGDVKIFLGSLRTEGEARVYLQGDARLEPAQVALGFLRAHPYLLAGTRDQLRGQIDAGHAPVEKFTWLRWSHPFDNRLDWAQADAGRIEVKHDAGVWKGRFRRMLDPGIHHILVDSANPAEGMRLELEWKKMIEGDDTNYQ